LYFLINELLLKYPLEMTELLLYATIQNLDNDHTLEIYDLFHVLPKKTQIDYIKKIIKETPNNEIKENGQHFLTYRLLL